MCEKCQFLMRLVDQSYTSAIRALPFLFCQTAAYVVTALLYCVLLAIVYFVLLFCLLINAHRLSLLVITDTVGISTVLFI